MNPNLPSTKHVAIAVFLVFCMISSYVVGVSIGLGFNHDKINAILNDENIVLCKAPLNGQPACDLNRVDNRTLVDILPKDIVIQYNETHDDNKVETD